MNSSALARGWWTSTAGGLSSTTPPRLGQFRRDLIEMVGWDDARRILTRMGYFWGQADAATMKRLFHWDSVEEWLKAGPRLQRIWGIGTTEPISFGLDAAVRQFLDGIRLPGFGRGGPIPRGVRDFGQALLLGSHGVFQWVCFLLPGEERVLRGARVPRQGR